MMQLVKRFSMRILVLTSTEKKLYPRVLNERDNEIISYLILIDQDDSGGVQQSIHTEGSM